MTDACWYCRRPGELLCDFITGAELVSPLCSTPNCPHRASLLVGVEEVGVCDACADALHRRKRTRKPFDDTAKRPTTCDAAACRRCAARFGWRTVMSAIVCVRSGKGRGCHDGSTHHCHAHTAEDPEAAPTGEALRAACAALHAETPPTATSSPRTGWRGNNKLFLDELREGRRWQEWAAAELELRGLQVELPEHSERGAIEDADRWTRGDKDLIVRGSAVGDCVLEVKARPLYFIDAAGYPYPTALIDTVDGWHAKEVEPRAVLLVSRPAKRILVVSAATRREWVVKQATDRVRNTRADFYECPRSRLASLEWLVSKLLP